MWHPPRKETGCREYPGPAPSVCRNRMPCGRGARTRSREHPGGEMFDVEEFVDACRHAIDETEPVLAVRDVLERAVADRSAIASALPPERGELTPLFVSDRLTVLKIVWTPGMVLGPH